jgi:hypothetical protein
MAKRRQKNWNLILTAIFALFAVPIASAACRCANHRETKLDKRSVVGVCCCARIAPQTSAVGEKKSIQTEDFNAQLLQPQFKLKILVRDRLIRFYRSENFYNTLSRISNKPSRAPPSL